MGVTVVSQEGDVEIVTDGNQPQSVSDNASQEALRVYHHNIYIKTRNTTQHLMNEPSNAVT